MTNYDTLKELAGVAPSKDPTQHADQLYANSFVSKSDTWVDRHTHLDPQAKYTLWNLNIGTDQFSSANPYEYHRIREELHPLGQEAARKEYLDQLEKELGGLDYPDQETIIRNKARQLPEYAWHYLDEMSTLQQRENSKLVNRANRANYDTHIKIFAGLDFTGVDPDVSRHAHTDDLMAAVDLGKAHMVSVVKGRLSLPDSANPTGYSPIFSLPKGGVPSVEQLKMNRMFIRPAAYSSMESGYSASLTQRRLSERDTLDMEYNRTTSPDMPREFVANSLIDRDSTKIDGATLTIKQIGNIIESRVPKYASFKELLLDTTELYTDVLQSTSRRISDGREDE